MSNNAHEKSMQLVIEPSDMQALHEVQDQFQSASASILANISVLEALYKDLGDKSEPQEVHCDFLGPNLCELRSQSGRISSMLHRAGTLAGLVSASSERS